MRINTPQSLPLFAAGSDCYMVTTENALYNIERVSQSLMLLQSLLVSAGLDHTFCFKTAGGQWLPDGYRTLEAENFTAFLSLMMDALNIQKPISLGEFIEQHQPKGA